ncbi:MAG: ABC transporter permease [Spirochaetaceae bacterium]|jgi:ribose/xylose/arabinose/galactoside ABC-type transport system permease subunit|nr:ABC transporter permease [Spirochaetaceae bacterium]GMO17001.1 MAG: ABC transporter permease [Termitinemataceae bacterium]
MIRKSGGTKLAESALTHISVLRECIMLVVLVALVIILSALSPAFASAKNFINIFKQASINGILATGMMCVILTGGFDLSVGSIVGFSGVIAALFAQGNTPIVVPLALGIGAGLLIGFVNGVCISFFAIPAFVVTLGTQSIVRGLAYLASGGMPVFGVSKSYENIAGTLLFDFLPMLVVYYVAIVLLTGFMLTKTVYGRRIYMTGGNEQAARFSGINTNFIKLSVYGICGLLAGLAGCLLTSRTISGTPVTGVGYELDAIAAVVIGGVSLEGGSGKWYGPMTGALLLAIISNGLDIMRVPSYYQWLLKGVIIICAVFLDVRAKARVK